MWTLSDEDIANIEQRAQNSLTESSSIGALRLGHVLALIRDLRELHKLRVKLLATVREAHDELERTPPL